MAIEYQQGVENWDIPYFEGMQSVKLPVLQTIGKNLYNKATSYSGWVSNETGEILEKDSLGNIDNIVSDYIKVRPSEQYVSNTSLYQWYYDGNKRFIKNSNTNGVKIIPPNNAKYVVLGKSISRNEANFQSVLDSLQLEKGSTSTTYEPYKTNILTVNEPVELRGIGEVRDTLDCLTGEVTERIGEIILDGSQSFNKYTDVDGFSTCGFYTTVPSNFKNHFITDNTILCDEIKVATNQQIQTNLSGVKDEEAISINSGYIKFRIDGSKATTVEELKSYLSSNPITLVVPLIENIIKTVDLTVVDQDGEPTKLKTFDGITHVEIGSDQIIPELDLEVATTIEETMTAISLNGDAIDIKQDELVVKVNDQIENIDETMMATTEIYEQTYKEDE